MINGSLRKFKKLLCVFILSFSVLAGIVCPAFTAYAITPDQTDFLAEYQSVIFGADKGLLSAETNALTQTSDGYIWAGTYSGLYRYDGVRFEKIDSIENVSNVMALFAFDDKLYIGTNDSGVCIYNIYNGSAEFITTEDGLPSDSIRCITRDNTGNIYIGTVSGLAYLTQSGELISSDEFKSLGTIRCIGADDKYISGVTNAGVLFFIEGESVKDKFEYDEAGVYYEAVSHGNGDEYLVGTSEDYALRVTYDGELKIRRKITTNGLSYFNRIIYDEASGSYYFSAENGLGIIYDGGTVTDLSREKFASSVSDCFIDYQNNIWFASNKQGILEYSLNPFKDLFVKAGFESGVVNSVLVLGDLVYIAMDNGLKCLDTSRLKAVNEDWLSYFEGVRIRHLFSDSDRNLWISTYGKDGLIKVTPEGEAEVFHESIEGQGTLGGRFRYCTQLSDGTIAAASNMGINFIKNDKVVSTLGESDDMKVPQILTMVESAGGELYAGSDGDGVYVIKDGKIIRNIGKEDGLTTLIVLRIVPYGDGFFYVTSNALFYDNGDEVVKLDKFPYSNNYDIFITENGEAWVSSSAGIFVVDADDLVSNGDYNYTLLDYSRGFNTSLTANAWNDLLGDDGDLLLCCTDGVRLISTKEYDSYNEDYCLRVKAVLSDDNEVLPQLGVYNIPSSARRVQIKTAVLNFSLSNPTVRVYLEGAKDAGFTVRQDELRSLEFTNMPYGRYKLHIQVLSGNEQTIVKDETFEIFKKPRLTELLIVRIGLVLLGIFVVAAGVYYIVKMTIINRQYDQIREAKEEAERANGAKSRFLANISHEIRTPINTIMGMDEMILREDRSQETAEYSKQVLGYASQIKRASESLLGLINDILDLSKIESGKMNLVERDYDPVELFRGICGMIRVRSNEKDLGFSTDIDPELPAMLYGDDGKIKQVLLNLLTNAVKYTEKGSFKLSVKILDKEGDKVRIRYSVKDTGMGIRPEDMDKLFSAFERLDEKKNSGIQGTGLGLNISVQFVELMGGKLQCESEYGVGSEFYFEILQGIKSDTVIGEFVEKSDVDTESRYVPLFRAPSARILSVDDNEMNLKVLQGLLKGVEIEVDSVTGGKECLDKAVHNNYDIILLDHMMPEMDGIETMHELTKRGVVCPVIALTANSATSGEDYYKSQGFTGFLAKPVDGATLEAMIKELLPADKVLPVDRDEYLANAADDEAEAIDIKELEGVEGINVSDGVKFCGGMREFKETLHTFRDCLEEKYAEIEKAFQDKDYEFFTIKVHALKSSARIIGAQELSKLAEALENAGNAKDTETIEKKTGPLLKLFASYREKLKNLKAGDAEDPPEDGNLEEIDEETLAEAYEALEEFAQSLDYDSFEAVLDSLKEYRLKPEDADRMAQLRKHLKSFDWEKIQEIMGGRDK